MDGPTKGWLAPLLVLMVGSFLPPMDSSIVSVAISFIQKDLGGGADDIAWVSTAYSLGLAVFVPTSNWLANRLGLTLLHRIAMVGFLEYASRNRLLMAEGGEQQLVKTIVSRWRVGLVIYGSAIALSFLSTEISLGIYVFSKKALLFGAGFGWQSATVANLWASRKVRRWCGWCGSERF